MSRQQVMVVGVLVTAVLLAGYKNKQLQIELDNANRTLLATQKIETTNKKEMSSCVKELKSRIQFVDNMEKEKIELAGELAKLQQQFSDMDPQAADVKRREKEINSLRDKLKRNYDNGIKEKRKLQELQTALDILAKEEEKRNAEKAKIAAKAQPDNKKT